MFLMLPCPTITDGVKLQPIGDLGSVVPRLNETRALLKSFSDTQKLIQQVQSGEVIMSFKVRFDQYIKAQVDLMKTYVSTGTNCQFAYNGFFGSKSIMTATMGPKQQWGFEIIMSRLLLSSIYIAGSLKSIEKMFQETVNSYQEGYSNSGIFSQHLQIMWKYFGEGIAPLKRMYPIVEDVAKLFSPYVLGQYPEANPDVFKFFTELYMANLAFLKLQKYRLLKEYKSCKQGAWAVYEKMKELNIRQARLSEQYELSDVLKDYIKLGIVFFKTYALHFMLLENESLKTQHQYGFIKKQFQQMVVENLTLADEILKLQTIAKKLPGQDNDNVIFATMIIEAMATHAQSIKIKFDINIHETKIQRPSIEQVVSQIQHRNIWNELGEF